MEPWLSACRAAVADLERLYASAQDRDERERVLGEGEGGDETTWIDAEAERLVVARLEAVAAAGRPFALVSEELGEKSYGGGPWRVVLDPIDGSVNAKRAIPFFSLSVAIAAGPRMEDVVFGFVHDFGAREEWTASRGGGAFLNGAPLGPDLPKEEIEILSFEATLTTLVADRAPHMVGVAKRLRIMGSLAITLCHLAAGRVDAVVSLRPARSVDIAAAQLLVRERGIPIFLPDVTEPFGAAPLDLKGRSRVVAAGTEAACDRLHAALCA